MRDEVVDFVNRWSSQAEVAVAQMTTWLGVRSSKFYDWQSRYGKVNEHNAWVSRDPRSVNEGLESYGQGSMRFARMFSRKVPFRLRTTKRRSVSESEVRKLGGT